MFQLSLKEYFSDGYSLRRSDEPRIVPFLAVLCPDHDTVISRTTFVKVVRLEVEGGLGEAVTVGEVMYSISDIETIHNGRIAVGSGFGILVGIVFIFEDPSFFALACSPPISECNGIITPRPQASHSTVHKWRWLLTRYLSCLLYLRYASPTRTQSYLEGR